ncbi:MAG: autotransporter domain-containing protein [Alphaproteobacteria bacterium]|nr:autotransporter domain-containing protein [Alphaproteobacteria bacterium]
MDIDHNNGRARGRKHFIGRALGSASFLTLALAAMAPGTASATPAVFFNEDTSAGLQTFIDTVLSADAAFNTTNPTTPRTSDIYKFDILNTTGGTFTVSSTNGGDDIVVQTVRLGTLTSNSETGDAGSDGFTNWGNSYASTFADAEAMGYTYKFFAADGVTPYDLNAIGTYVNDWGTCCTNGVDPDGNPTGASEVYLRFGASDPMLLGGISNSIGGTEHFIGAINDTNFFNSVTIIATGNGEYFGAGGYLTFSTVALNSVPNGSSSVDGSLGGGSGIPDIDMASSYYTGSQLNGSQVNPNFVGGTLMFADNTAVGASFTVQSQGGTIDTEGNAVVVTGQFSGVGGMTKTGAGILALSGVNTLQGGFTIGQGALQISQSESLGTGTLTIGNGALQVAGEMTGTQNMVVGDASSRIDVANNSVAWNGQISGNGTLNMLGAGRLELTGANTYSGGTYIEQGTLAGSSRSLQGNIENNGTVEFNQSQDGLFAGIMSGTGGLRKLGGGMLTLTGNSTMTGTSTVETGSLSVNGRFGTRELTVYDGASLYGSGMVDGSVRVLSGGTLTPGNSPGTLYVSGDVTLNAGSLFVTEIDGRDYSLAGGAGSYDRVVLTGLDATFTAAGSVNPILRGISGNADNDFEPIIGDVFTIVTAANVEGAFDALTQPEDGLADNTRFRVVYNADSIQLALVADSLAAAVKQESGTGNAAAAGAAIDYGTANGDNATGELAALLNSTIGMRSAQISAMLDSLSGDIHAHVLESTESVLIGTDDIVMAAAQGHTGVGGVDRELKDGVRVWSRVDARSASYDPDAATMGFDEDTYGVTLGATFINTSDMRVGVAASYNTVDLYTDTANGVTNHMASVYAYGSRTVTPRLTMSGLVGYTHASPKTSRATPMLATYEGSKSKEDFSVMHVQAEARYALAQRGATSVFAIGGLRAASLNQDGYTEYGTFDYAQLDIKAESRNTLQSKIGGEIVHTYRGTDLTVFTNWARDLGNDPTVERTVSLGNAIWQTQSVDRSLDTYNYGANARRNITDRVGFEIEYTGRYNSDNYDAQQLMLGVNVAW